MRGLCLSNNVDMSSVSPAYPKMNVRNPLRFFFRLTVRIPAKSRWCINTETALEFFHQGE